MTKLIVDIPGEKSYDVIVAKGALSRLGDLVTSCKGFSRVLILTDACVAKYYLDRAKKSLEQAGCSVSAITVPSGEEAKSVTCAAEIWNAMVDCKLDRSSVVVALGGGVVGDLAGFTASTYMRGVRVVQVPTTLLSMVDSSVGGKTAINLDAGKNLVGTFWQPEAVCADISVLESLPDREWACGCAEIVKSAVIDSDEFFFWMIEQADGLKERNPLVVQEAIVRSIAFKARVVAEDQLETKGVRESLNYGHTLAHAIETKAGYGVYSHGHAVAQGMRFAARLGAAYFGTSTELIAAQDELLDSLMLPSLSFKADAVELLEIMMGDKKVRGNELRFVLPRDLGDWEVVALDKSFVLEHLQAWQRSIV